MTGGEPPARPAATEVARESAEYAERIRRTNERLALLVAGLLALVAVLPTTQPEHRDGVLWSALVLLVTTLIWFRIVPARAFGDRRVAVFAFLLQPGVILLLSTTGGTDSPYLPLFLFPVLTTIYSPRTRHTVAVAAISSVSLLAVALLARGEETPAARAVVVGGLATDLLELVAFALFTAYAGRALRDARRAITLRAEELESERKSAMTLAFTDPLTGLYNRRYAEEQLGRLIAEAARGRPFSVLAIDLDGLKRINDSLGHDAGDRVLARIGELLRLQLRGADVAARLGGDEFAALLPGTREDQAESLSVRLRAAVRDSDWSTIGAAGSISVGAWEWRAGQSGQDVLKAADARLYEAKRARPASG